MAGVGNDDIGLSLVCSIEELYNRRDQIAKGYGFSSNKCLSRAFSRNSLTNHWIFKKIVISSGASPGICGVKLRAMTGQTKAEMRFLPVG